MSGKRIFIFMHIYNECFFVANPICPKEKIKKII